MKSKLFLIPMIALMAIGISVNAQEKKMSELQPKDQVIDRYQAQKKAVQSTFKRDMDALNDQKNLTPEQKEVRRKQIIAAYQQQKKANQETFENQKEALKTTVKKAKETDKMEDRHENRMKEKHVNKAKEHRENKIKERHVSKPPVAHKEHR